MDKEHLINQIDKYLVSPDFNINLYRMYENIVQKQFQEGKRLFLFNFKSLESLLRWLEKTKENKEDIDFVSLTWDEWDNCKIGGKHINMVLQARNVPTGVALMISSEEYCCSVTAIKL